MDGEAEDAIIDANGNLVMLDAESPQETTVNVIEESAIIAVVVQSAEGDLSVQCFGSPSKELVDALYLAVQGLMSVVKQ